MTTQLDQVTQTIKRCSRTAFEHTKSSFITLAEKMEKEMLLAAVNDIAKHSGNIVKEVRTHTRMLLRPGNIDTLLLEIHMIMDVKNNENSPVKHAVDTRKHSAITRQGINYKIFRPDCSVEAGIKLSLAAILWYELNDIRRNEHLRKEVGRIRSWNQRVNEHDLIRKLGSQKDWNVFDNSRAEHIHSDSGKQFEDSERFVLGIDKASSVDTDVCRDEFFSSKILEAEDISLKDLREFNTVEQKKRQGVLHTIKKLFKSEKDIPVARSSTSNAQHIRKEKHNIGHSSLSQTDNKHTTVKDYLERLRSKNGNEHGELATGDHHYADKLGSTEPRTDITDTDNNNLLIHIPRNVQKIILVKNGRKITLEI